VSHATVIRNVAQLEASLGIRLFDRVRTGYRITGDGEDVLASTRAMQPQAEALTRQALGRNPTPAGRLKLAACDASLFDAMHLLSGFRRAHPRIEVALQSEANGVSRLAKLHVDAAFFVGNAPPDELIGRQLARVRLGWFSAGAALPRRSAPDPDDCDFIAWTMTGSSELDDAWQRTNRRRLTSRPRVVLQADSHRDALGVVREGLGTALLNEAHAKGLRRLPFTEPSETFGVWLLTHPDIKRAGRVRALFDFVNHEQRSSRTSR
jgi:DNA-binding transcriptional LysR family regulator